MKLVGLRAGSAKNNYFGIGAKVELRAGNLYQTMVVTDPEYSFRHWEPAKAEYKNNMDKWSTPEYVFSRDRSGTY